MAVDGEEPKVPSIFDAIDAIAKDAYKEADAKYGEAPAPPPPPKPQPDATNPKGQLVSLMTNPKGYFGSFDLAIGYVAVIEYLATCVSSIVTTKNIIATSAALPPGASSAYIIMDAALGLWKNFRIVMYAEFQWTDAALAAVAEKYFEERVNYYFSLFETAKSNVPFLA